MTKQDKLNQLAKAANLMATAIDALTDVVNDKSDYHYVCEDARYYRNQLQELLSCDGGESGLHNLIAIVNKEVTK